mmetsp:Transcript_26207/g.73452  ORF Transcript_26207/g.73452 Transcript_26207/m.73452 type:complete len:508 (+) Transcript_26207:4143-5666(+)
MEAARVYQCYYPYECKETGDWAESMFPCVEGIPLATTFFGRELNETISSFFLEFMWTLENSILVRGGNEFDPSKDYIDQFTTAVEIVLVFYSPPDMIASVVNLVFDTSGQRISSDYTFAQLVMLEDQDQSAWRAWSISAAVFVTISIILAAPAAYQELRLFMIRALIYWGIQKQGEVRLERYTADTSQPDFFDVVLCVALLAYTLVYTVHMSMTVTDGPEAFYNLASINWASTESFSSKTSEYLASLSTVLVMVEEIEQIRSVAFWMLILCCFRVILYLKVHPLIAGVAQTFEVCFWELLNFFFSFGVIYLLLAFIAYIKFGNMYDEFSSIGNALITQFAILIGDDTPDYSSNNILFFYVVLYVLVCTLALLNFLLAIVVAGYDGVREKVLENQVVTSFAMDSWSVFTDSIRWMRHRWPQKNCILSALWHTYPQVFQDTDSQVAISQGEFVVMMLRVKEGLSEGSAKRLFLHLHRFRFLQAPEEAAAGGKGSAGPGVGSQPPEYPRR